MFSELNDRAKNTAIQEVKRMHKLNPELQWYSQAIITGLREINFRYDDIGIGYADISFELSNKKIRIENSENLRYKTSYDQVFNYNALEYTEGDDLTDDKLIDNKLVIKRGRLIRFSHTTGKPLRQCRSCQHNLELMLSQSCNKTDDKECWFYKREYEKQRELLVYLLRKLREIYNELKHTYSNYFNQKNIIKMCLKSNLKFLSNGKIANDYKEAGVCT